MVYMLLAKKTMTAKELAEHFEVCSRTIYRDVETLAQAGIPIYTTKGNGGGIHLTESFVLNKSVLTEEEQKNILTSLQGMNALNIEEVQPVLSKLGALFGSENENWVEIDFSSWNPDHLVSQRFTMLKGAIISRYIVTFIYSAMNGETQLREVEPMKLVYRSSDWYLYAFCCLRKDFRFFKLIRMDELKVTENVFTRKQIPPQTKSYTLPKADNQVQIKVRISAKMAYKVRDEFATDQIKILQDCSYVVNFFMPENEWLYEYLLCYGPEIEVLEPECVKKELVRRLQKALSKYEIGQTVVNL